MVLLFIDGVLGPTVGIETCGFLKYHISDFCAAYMAA